MPLVVLASGIVFLFILVIVFKLNAFLSLLFTALFVGIFQGMELLSIVHSIEAGVGGTLGHLGIIIALGAILGKLLSDGGGAQQIATTLIRTFGQKYVNWAMCLASFILGAILFWEVSFVLLIPIVYTVAVEARVRLIHVGMPFLVAISIAHCFLPPHPGPMLIAAELQANVGLVLLYGLIIAIPCTIIFGPIAARFYPWDSEIPHHLATKTDFEERQLPGFGISLFAALLPVFLILIGEIANALMPKESAVRAFLRFMGNADIALLAAVVLAIYVFGLRDSRRTMPDIMKSVEHGLMGMGAILFVVGGGGAFKQVILDSGMAEYIRMFTSGWDISPLVLAWLITICIRLCVGSATVTVTTASGIVAPIAAASGASPELMVLAVATGSVFAGPPNDVAFWFVKEYFNLTIIQTVKLWCVFETLLSLFGLAGVLLLNMLIYG